MPSSSASLVPGPLCHPSPLLPPLHVLKKKQERHQVQSHPKGCDGTRAGKEEGMEGFLGLVPTSNPLSLGQASASQGGHCLPLFRQEALSPERPHNMPPPLAEALEEAGSTQGGRAPGVFSSLSPRAHRIPPMGSLKRRDQKGHSNASALPLVAGITTEGRGLGCMGHFQ